VLPIKKRIGHDGEISISDVLKKAQIKPGTLVQISAAKNKIIIRTVKKNKRKGTIEAVAGILSGKNKLVEEMLRIRSDEDDRHGTVM